MAARTSFFLFIAVVIELGAAATLPLRRARSVRKVATTVEGGLALLQTVSSQDSPCTDGPEVTREACLSKSAECMWLETDSKNLCLPCEWGGVAVPCVPSGSVFALKKVRQCDMKCAHQEVLTKVSACTDVTGFITQDDCFLKGISAATKCMFTTYTTASGQSKNMCGPCTVEGVGTVPPYTPGNLGPEPGSTVSASVSQCALGLTEYGQPCDGGLGIPAVTNCAPTAPPILTPAPIPLKALRIQTEPGAPTYTAVIVAKPYGKEEYAKASEVAAAAAGWAPGTILPPDAPITVFGPPPLEGPTLPPGMKASMASPPPGLAGVVANGFAAGTVPPMEEGSLIQDAAKGLRKRLRL